MDKCLLAFNITFHPIYRFSQFYTLAVSLAAVYPLAFLIYRQLWRSIFHGNLKALLIAYFSQILFSALLNSIIFAHHSLQPLVADSPCDLLISKPLFQVLQPLAVLAISSPTLVTLAISIERVITLIFADCYEHHRVLIGPLLLLFIGLIELLLIYHLFKDETFDDHLISFLMTPSTSANGLNVFFWSLFSANSANLVVNCTLLYCTNCLAKRRRGSLSTRFQMEELIVTTKFTVCVSLIHVLFFAVYLSCILAVRTLGERYFANYINYMVARGIFNTVPTYNLLIGPVAIFWLDRLSKLRSRRVQHEVQIKYGGKEGALKHDLAIQKYWNSVIL
ncbi:unnamed protein product [Caenorhabditis bovis]|uniref:G-protein coupled receptors family 1 profile domain-containing protein n=1 Tax=Caenorhabditis bovis TaxID=2654633 RepID=A0A8S1ETS1_9PELO|nr:unnamed protein product [Caenorhabditis bovis]